MCEMHRMPMVHAKTNGAHTLEAFSIIITIISIDTKKVMLLIFRTYFVSFMVNASLIMKQDQIELERSASFQCSMFNVQCSMFMFNVLRTVYCGRGCVSLESERGKELA